MADLLPELYQVVGATLRDVAQARFMSDLFSRQISFVYEGDGVLRRFPVPRVDINEAEITLYFAIKEVALDPQRHTSRNAAIGSLFDQYSVRIVRETMHLIRKEARDAAAAASEQTTKDAIGAFETRYLSDDNRELLTGRLLQYFNESVDKIIRSDGSLDVGKVLADLDADVTKSVLRQPQVQTLNAQFAPADWERLVKQARDGYVSLIGQLAEDVKNLRDKYPDYRVVVDPSMAGVSGPGAPVSSIKIKSSVRNYKWSKVDVDDADLRNIRTLNPE